MAEPAMPAVEAEFRQCILALAARLVAMRVGPTNHTDTYNQITEGRKDWTKPDGSRGVYSWCGDFVTFCLAECGLSAPDMLNRNPNFEIGKNISKLIHGAQARKAWLDGAQVIAALASGLISPGDPIVLERPNGDHVGFIEKIVSAATVVTVDGNSVGGVCARNTRTFGPENRVRGVVQLGTVLKLTPPGAACGPTDALCNLLGAGGPDMGTSAMAGAWFPAELTATMDALLTQGAFRRQSAFTAADISRAASLYNLLNTRYGAQAESRDTGIAERTW